MRLEMNLGKQLLIPDTVELRGLWYSEEGVRFQASNFWGKRDIYKPKLYIPPKAMLKVRTVLHVLLKEKALVIKRFKVGEESVVYYGSSVSFEGVKKSFKDPETSAYVSTILIEQRNKVISPDASQDLYKFIGLVPILPDDEAGWGRQPDWLVLDAHDRSIEQEQTIFANFLHQSILFLEQNPSSEQIISRLHQVRRKEIQLRFNVADLG